MRMLLARRSVRLRADRAVRRLVLAVRRGGAGHRRRCGRNASHELRSRLTTMRASVDVAVAKPRSVRSHSRRALGEISDSDLVAFLVSQLPTVEVRWQERG
jgi:hypothetical protein